MDNTKLIAEARAKAAEPMLGKSQWRELDKSIAMIRRLADALEAAEAALKFKQGLIEDISRDCERAEAAAPERTLTDADLDRFETTAEPIYRSTVEAAKASKFLVSTLAQWVMRLTAEVRRLGGAPVSLEAVKADPTGPCKQDVPGTVPSWAGEDQIDPCACLLASGHDGAHRCAHAVETEGDNRV